MPLFYAALADSIFIFGSNITMRRINRAFAEAFGPGSWKRKDPVVVTSIPAMVPPFGWTLGGRNHRRTVANGCANPRRNRCTGPRNGLGNHRTCPP